MSDESNMDIYRVIKTHRSKNIKGDDTDSVQLPGQSERSNLNLEYSDIPDVFFDQVIVEIRLSRIEILVLMYLYRRVWCRPNLFSLHGISPMLSLAEMANSLKIELQEVHASIRSLEKLGFLKTIRSGQYFVRKYFLKDLDERFDQTYDDFEV